LNQRKAFSQHHEQNLMVKQLWLGIL